MRTLILLLLAPMSTFLLTQEVNPARQAYIASSHAPSLFARPGLMEMSLEELAEADWVHAAAARHRAAQANADAELIEVATAAELPELDLPASNRFDLEANLAQFGFGERLNRQAIGRITYTAQGSRRRGGAAEVGAVSFDAFASRGAGGAGGYASHTAGAMAHPIGAAGSVQHGRSATGEHVLAAVALGFYQTDGFEDDTGESHRPPGAHIVPAPAAVGPGFMLLAGWLMSRPRRR